MALRSLAGVAHLPKRRVIRLAAWEQSQQLFSFRRWPLHAKNDRDIFNSGQHRPDARARTGWGSSSRMFAGTWIRSMTTVCCSPRTGVMVAISPSFGTWCPRRVRGRSPTETHPQAAKMGRGRPAPGGVAHRSSRAAAIWWLNGRSSVLAARFPERLGGLAAASGVGAARALAGFAPGAPDQPASLRVAAGLVRLAGRGRGAAS